MRLPSLLSLVGFILMLIGTYCPMLRPFHLFNLDVYHMSQPFGLLLMLMAVIGIISTGLNQLKISRFTAVLSLCLVIALFIATVLKIKANFSFIPFKGLNAFLIGQIKFKWGWFVLFAGPAMAVIGNIFSGRSSYITGKTKYSQPV